MEKTDFLGKELEIGDSVVFVQVGYRNLMIGQIIKITPQTLLISHDRTNVGHKQSKQFHDQVVKVTKPIIKEAKCSK